MIATFTLLLKWLRVKICSETDKLCFFKMATENLCLLGSRKSQPAGWRNSSYWLMGFARGEVGLDWINSVGGGNRFWESFEQKINFIQIMLNNKYGRMV